MLGVFGLNLGGTVGTERFLVGNRMVFGRNLLEELLIDFGGFKVTDVLDGHVQVVGFLLVEQFAGNLQEFSLFHVAHEDGVHVGVDDFTLDFADEKLLASLVQIIGIEVAVVVFAVLHGDEIVVGNDVRGAVLAMAFAKVVDVVVDLFVGGGHFVAGEGRNLGIVDVEFGLDSDLEGEDELLGVFEIDLCAVVDRQGFAEDIEFVLMHVVVQCLVHQVVHRIGDEGLFIHFLNEAHRGVSDAEAGDLGGAALLLQSRQYFLCVICFANLNAQNLHRFVLFFF